MVDFNALLERKYNILQQNANANTAEANAKIAMAQSGQAIAKDELQRKNPWLYWQKSAGQLDASAPTTDGVGRAMGFGMPDEAADPNNAQLGFMRNSTGMQRRRVATGMPLLDTTAFSGTTPTFTSIRTKPTPLDTNFRLGLF